MSYSELIGNAHVPRLLEAMLRRGRLARALLFAGQESLGKKQFALRFARILLCRDRATNACAACTSCRQFGTIDPSKPSHRGINFRLIGLEKDDKNISIDSIREALHEIYLHPPEGQRYLLIVDSAESLSHEAMNAMLKTLEEPPDYATIILIATHPSRLLPTIVSRCQKIPFYPLSDRDIRNTLEKRFKKDPARIPWATRLAQGSMGRALQLMESEGEALRTLQDRVFQNIHQKRLEPLIDILFPKGGPSGEAQRTRASVALEFLIQAFREVLQAQHRKEAATDTVFADPAWMARYRSSDPKQLALHIESLQEAQYAIDLNANVKIAVEDALLRIAT